MLAAAVATDYGIARYISFDLVYVVCIKRFYKLWLERFNYPVGRAGLDIILTARCSDDIGLSPAVKLCFGRIPPAVKTAVIVAFAVEKI